jgi:hypothetical protein
MSDDLLERIKKISNEYGFSVNELINMACEEFLKSGKFDDFEKRLLELEKEVVELKKK